MKVNEAVAEFCNPIAERAILSHIMKNTDDFYSVSSKISGNDFLYTPHKVIFTIMNSLAEKKFEKFNVDAIVNEAVANGVLSSVEGYDYVDAISNVNVMVENLEANLAIINEGSTKFKLWKVLNDNLSDIIKNSKSGKDSERLIGQIENQILDLSMTSKAIKEPTELGEGFEELIAQRKLKKIERIGLSTGYSILDMQLDGLTNGSLTIIAARKKMGKSAFLTNIACNVAYNMTETTPVLYVDTEMGFDEFRDRAIANITGLEERIVKHGGYNDYQMKRLDRAKQLFARGKLFHEYMPAYSVDNLVALYKKYKIKEHIGLMVFDYLKEPAGGSEVTYRKEYQILGDVATKLKDLANQLKIPCLAAAQLNRDNDVADSDKIARYADVIAFWRARDPKDIAACGLESGNFTLDIKDSRRGGRTPEEGICYNFYKRKLAIREVPIELQAFQGFGQENVINYGDIDYDSTDTAYEDIKLK